MKKILIVAAILLLGGVSLHAFYSYRTYNVILITIDTLRPEYLSCYNPSINKTPNIDRIAQQGVLFTNAHTLIPITMPAHTAMLTSRSPAHVRVFNNGDRFDHPAPLITHLLKPKGYKTGAFISLGVLNKGFGLAPGFDVYDDNFDATNGRFYKVASEVNAAALPWIEQNRNKRFFSWIHYSDPHEPYVTVDAPPDTEIFVNGQSQLKICLAKKEKIALEFSANPGINVIEFRALQSESRRPIAQSSRFLDPRMALNPADAAALEYGNEWQTITLKNRSQVRYFQSQASVRIINRDGMPKKVQLRFTGGVWETNVREIRRNYAAEVRFTDQYIGELWKKLSEWKLLSNTIIILTADHGEGLKTHGILGHVDKLWDETTRIPFIVYYPGMGRQGEKEDRLINLLDITPTILDLLHIGNNKTMEGQSLKASLSRSPLDRLLVKNHSRKWTFACTFAPEAAMNAFSMTDGKLKIIHTPAKNTWEAYDLVTDPLERKNMARWNVKRYESLAPLRKLLEAHTKEMQYAHDDRSNPALDEKEREMLESLGYFGNGDEE